MKRNLDILQIVIKHPQGFQEFEYLLRTDVGIKDFFKKMKNKIKRLASSAGGDN